MEINEIKKNHFEIQKAVKFIVDKFLNEDGTQKKLHTDKPVLKHSLGTGFLLLNYGYDKEIVISGMFHDVMEDADVTYDEISERFGKRVADIVQAVSVDRRIENGPKRVKDLHTRETKLGRDAILVAIADLFENLPFLKYAKDEDEYNSAKSRWFTFLNEVAVSAKDEPIYEDFKKKMDELAEVNFSPDIK